MKKFTHSPRRKLLATGLTFALALGSSACSFPDEGLYPITKDRVKYERDGTAIALTDSGALGWIDLRCGTTEIMEVMVVDPNWIVIAKGEIPSDECADMFLEPGDVDLADLPEELKG